MWQIFYFYSIHAAQLDPQKVKTKGDVDAPVDRHTVRSKPVRIDDSLYLLNEENFLQLAVDFTLTSTGFKYDFARILHACYISMIISYHVISYHTLPYTFHFTVLYYLLPHLSFYSPSLSHASSPTNYLFTSISLLLRIQFRYCRPASLNTLKEQKKSGEGFQEGKMNFSTYQLVRTAVHLFD